MLVPGRLKPQHQKPWHHDLLPAAARSEIAPAVPNLGVRHCVRSCHMQQSAKHTPGVHPPGLIGTPWHPSCD